MTTIGFTGARMLTMAPPGASGGPRRGHALADNGLIENGWLIIEDGQITGLGEGNPPETDFAQRIIQAEGRVLMPALVDCHTHACWAGDRSDEFEQRLAGASYLDILAAGGGIMATVRAVRNASEEELTQRLLCQLHRMARLGSTTIEVKSGYGLDPESELKMLRAIAAASERTPLTIVPTFLGAHALDVDAPDGTAAAVERIINDALPAAAQAFPGIACDAYCEEGAWSLADCRRLFENAEDLGCPIRVHTDQFNSLGMTRLAIEMGARSVDHLEATTPEDLQALAASETIGVLLPTSGFCLDERYAPGRELVDLGAAVAVASNANPGSAQSPSLPLAMALAARKCRLKPTETLTAATYNAACVLGLQDEIGSLEVGKRGEVILLDTKDERSLALELAGPGPVGVVNQGCWYDLDMR